MEFPPPGELTALLAGLWAAAFVNIFSVEPRCQTVASFLFSLTVFTIIWVCLGLWTKHIVSIHWDISGENLAWYIFLMSGWIIITLNMVLDAFSLIGFLVLTPVLLALAALFLSFFCVSLAAFYLVTLLRLCIQAIFYCIGQCIRAVVAGVFFVGLLAFSPGYLWSNFFLFRPPRYRTPGPLCVDECGLPRGALCGTCSTLVRSSALLTGTPLLFTGPKESHMHHTAAGLLSSAKQCHLCNLLSICSADQTTAVPGFTTYGTVEDVGPGGRSCSVEVHHGQALGFPSELSIQTHTSSSQEPLIIRKSGHCGITAAYDLPCKTNSLCRNTDSPASMKRAKGWITSCLKHHSNCRRAMPHVEDSFSPSRLIKVASVDLEHVFVVETAGKRGPFPYLALSHCWGKDRLFTLTAKNLDELKDAIPFDKLAANFRDAMKITVDLGFEYVWIDSLCILQGDEEDWKVESVLMGKVYANAACTISATASDSAAGGCFFPRDPFMGDCILGTQPFSSLLAKSPVASRKGLYDIFSEKVEAAPVTKRGWTYQERSLSKRVLHFSNGLLLFECNTHLATDYHLEGIPHQEPKYGLFRLRRMLLKTQLYADRILCYIIGLVAGTIRLIDVVAYVPDIMNSLAQSGLVGLTSIDIDVVESSSRIDYIGSRPLSRGVRSSRTIHTTTAIARPTIGPLPELYEIEWPTFPSMPEPGDDRVLPGFVGERRAFQAVTNHPKENWSVTETLEFHQQWMEIVGHYSRRTLTCHTDRLFAIVGVAGFVQEAVKTQFLAGLWRAGLGWNMLWKCMSPNKERPVRSIPTWSWASVDGEVTHGFEPDTTSGRQTGTIRQTLSNIKFLVNTDKWRVNVLQKTQNMVHNASLTVDGGDLVPFTTSGHRPLFSPDLLDEDYSDTPLFLLPIVELERDGEPEIHGIVVRRAVRNPDNIERAGYFSLPVLPPLPGNTSLEICIV